MTAVDFVMYNTQDTVRLRAWYVTTFGLKRGGEWHEGWSEFATEPILLCLNGPNPGETKAAIWGANGVVALVVADIHAAAKVCQRRKIPLILGPVETAVCWMLLIRDPEGNQLVLHQRKDGTSG